MLFSYLEELEHFGVEAFLLCFTVEPAEQAKSICELFGAFLRGERRDIPAEMQNRFTGGHYKRGVE
jgi:putative protease